MRRNSELASGPPLGTINKNYTATQPLFLNSLLKDAAAVSTAVAAAALTEESLAKLLHLCTY